jgi:hypothetical protein
MEYTNSGLQKDFMIKKILFTKASNIIDVISRRRQKKYNKEYSIQILRQKYKDRNTQHQYFHHYFWNKSPQWLKEHRSYFSKDRKSFGEDSFHAMWYLIFKEYSPKKVLEIGVYRGSTLSLFTMLSQKMKLGTDVHGISPFTSVGDSVSNYSDEIDYFQDVLLNYRRFRLPEPVLHVGFSTDKTMRKIISQHSWDIVFIDGNHDYEVVKQDFIACSSSLKKGGLIVLDDASLDTNFNPPYYSTAGHPGPSRVANEVNYEEYEEVLSVGHNRVFKKIF